MSGIRSCCVALIVAAAFVSLPAVAASPPVGGPASIPDLASMVLQPGDLATGSVPGQAAYFKPIDGFSAEYVGSFTKASTPDGVRYYEISDAIDFAENTTTPTRFFKGERNYFRSPSGREALAFEVVNKAGPKADLQPRQVRVRSRGGFGLGDASFLETAAIHVRHIRLEEDLVLVDQGPVFALLIIAAAPGQPIPRADAVAMATAVDAHIKSVLAQSAATGPSGVSGATGVGGVAARSAVATIDAGPPLRILQRRAGAPSRRVDRSARISTASLL